MKRILTGEERDTAFKKFFNTSYIIPVILMGIFTFLFLGTEYSYVNMISPQVSEQKTVLAQNYALGVSTIGFLLYPLYCRFLKKRRRTVVTLILAAAAVLCILMMQQQLSYGVTLISGLVLFWFLGLFGSAVYYNSVRMMENDRYLARLAGISYMIGILLQFANNNIIRTSLGEALILSAFLIILVFLLVKAEQEHSDSVKPNEKEAVVGNAETDSRTKNSAGILLILLVVLMTCVFSTLDNAVTLVHAAGAMDIGQWPRILLACSGLAAGFVFDIGKRKYMSLIMYCVMMLSTICIFVLNFGRPFLIGLIVFYMSAGFFSVFFTTGFMEISQHMRIPELWAGMGRAVNNITAAVIANASLALLSSENSMIIIILALVLFVAVSIVMAAYTVRAKYDPGEQRESLTGDLKRRDKLQEFSESYSFTDREKEVFDCLINSEDSIQTIAESLYISRRTLERYITSIYGKTGVKSRVGLIQLYNEK